MKLPPEIITVKAFTYRLEKRDVMVKYNKICFAIPFKYDNKLRPDQQKELRLVGADMDDCIKQMVTRFADVLPKLKREPKFQVIKGGKI